MFNAAKYERRHHMKNKNRAVVIVMVLAVVVAVAAPALAQDKPADNLQIFL